MPAATVDDDPKLDRMSLRTMPSSLNTSIPFEPSPGNGPAVSSGIVEHEAAVAADEVEVDDVEPLVVVVAPPSLDDFVTPQAAATRPRLAPADQPQRLAP